MFKIALLTLCLLSSFGAKADCDSCKNFLGELSVVLFSEENLEFQTAALGELFCEDGSPECLEQVTTNWLLLLEVLSGIEDLDTDLCTLMGADDNCGDWDESADDVDNCVDKVGLFIGLGDSDAFGDFVLFLASEDGFCGALCEESDADDCLEQCGLAAQEQLPKAFGALLEALELGTQGICEIIASK